MGLLGVADSDPAAASLQVLEVRVLAQLAGVTGSVAQGEQVLAQLVAQA